MPEKTYQQERVADSVLIRETLLAMIKRELLMLFLLLAALSGSNAQISNGSVKAGILYVHLTSGNYKGIGLYTEYNRALSKHLTLSPSIHFAYGSVGREFPYYLFNRSATGIDVNLFLSPLSLNKIKVRVGVGPALRYLTGYNIDDFTIADRASIVIGGGYTVPVFHPKRQLDNPNHLTLGYNTTIETEFNLLSSWLLGLRFSYQSYISKDKIVSLGCSVGYKF